jgi:hypothetical protein
VPGRRQAYSCSTSCAIRREKSSGVSTSTSPPRHSRVSSPRPPHPHELRRISDPKSKKPVLTGFLRGKTKSLDGKNQVPQTGKYKSL